MTTLPSSLPDISGLHTDYKAPCLADTLVVYRISVADFLGYEPALTSLLTRAEQQQVVRYVRPADQHRFRVGRACLRYLLGQRLGQPPTKVALEASRFGKPKLAAATGLHFNVAHSGNWVVIALAAREVGIDTEQMIPDFDFVDVAAERFNDAEQHQLAQSREPEALFYHLWTRLEAQTKAGGLGLSEEPRQPATHGSTPSQWTVQNFSLVPGYSGALAYPADWQPIIQFRSLSPQLMSWC